MSKYSLIFRLLNKPFVFDAGGHLDDRDTQALRSIFEPYALGKDRPGCMDKLHGTRVGMPKWPVLHLLAMMKLNNNRFEPSMVSEMVAGVTDFLEHDWLYGNKLMRETSRLVEALHAKGHSPIDPVEFVGLVAKDMERHFMSLPALKQMFVPEDWLDDADNDPCNYHLAEVLIKDHDLQRRLLTDLPERRFKAALVHYPRAALEVSLDRGERWEQLLAKDLGL